MPRKERSDIDQIRSVFQQFTNQIFNQPTKSTPVPSDPIWPVISNELLLHDIVLSARYCYTIVRQNRYDLWQHLGIATETVENITPSSRNSLNESLESEEKADLHTFEIKFSFEEFSSLIDQADYARGDSQGSTRTYTILKRRQWTSEIHDKFYDATHFPCAISYKHHRILPQGGVYLTINGKCRDCNSIFLGQIYQKPTDEISTITMQCEYRGPFYQCVPVSKRKLIGPQRANIVKKLLKEKKSGPYIRGEFARKHMVYGDKEPSQIPSPNAFRCAKYKESQKKLRSENPVLALCLLKGETQYQNIIHDIAIDKFKIHYWANEETQNYRLLCRQSKTPTLCIDATGTVVRKIDHISDKKSSHIFLYEMVAHDCERKIQFSVAHMLSEKHDNVTISAWLSEWQRSTGVIGPKIVVTDGSLALMYAVTRSFTQHSTLASYLTTCFKLVHGDDANVPNCMIRQDVNHIMHVFSTWHVFKRSHHPRFKKFYMKSLAVLVMSTNYKVALQIISSIFRVSLFEYQGHRDFCDAKELLLSKISGCDDTIKEILETYEDHEGALASQQFEPLEDAENSGDCTSFLEEVRQLFDEVNQQKNRAATTSEEDGEINALYCPDIARKLLVTCKFLPLWSGIMVPAFGYGHSTETSASVESTFKDLKHTIFKHIDLPTRVDKFVQKHIDSIIGAAILKKSNADDIETSDSEVDDPSDDVGKKEDFMKVLELNRKKPCNEFETSEQQPTNLSKIPAKNSSDFSSPRIERKEGLEKKSELDKYERHETKESKQQVEDRPETPTESLFETATENWRNLAPTTRRRKKTYFQPDPAIRTMKIESKSLSPVIGVLKNGTDNKLHSIQIDGIHYRLTNTCAFDAIIHCLSAAYSDSVIYQSYVNTLAEDHLLFELISLLIRNGVNVQSYRKRARILLDLKTVDKKKVFRKVLTATPGFYALNTASTAAYLITNLFRDFPSVKESRKCYTCGKQMERKRACITVNLPGYDMNDVDLSEILNNNIACGKKVCDEGTCKSSNIQCSYEMGQHVLVELSTPGIAEESNNALTNFDVTTTLSSIPPSLKICENEFKLRGCIVFLPSPCKEINAVGHYVAYSLRKCGMWDKYDDLSKQVERFDHTHNFILTKQIRISFVVYTR